MGIAQTNDNTKKMGSPEGQEEELVKKIERLEAGHAHLKQEMSKLKLSERRHRHRSHSLSPQRSRLGAGAGAGACNNKGSSSPLKRESRSNHNQHQHQHQNNDGEVGGSVRLGDRQYMNILQSMGHSLYILDLQCRIIYW